MAQRRSCERALCTLPPAAAIRGPGARDWRVRGRPAIDHPRLQISRTTVASRAAGRVDARPRPRGPLGRGRRRSRAASSFPAPRAWVQPGGRPRRPSRGPCRRGASSDSRDVDSGRSSGGPAPRECSRRVRRHARRRRPPRLPCGRHRRREHDWRHARGVRAGAEGRRGSGGSRAYGSASCG